MKKTLTFVLAAFMLVMAVFPAQAGSADTFVRAIHLSPDAPTVDVLANDALLFQEASFGDATPFTAVPSGNYNVKVVPTNTTSPVVIEADLNLEAGMAYSVLAVNTLDSIEPIVIPETVKMGPFRNSVVRFVHASPDAPAVDVAIKDGAVLIPGAQFKDVTDLSRAMPGSYDLEVRLAGTDTVVLDLPGITLESGKQYSVFATGLVGDGSLNALIVEDWDFS